MPYGLPSTSSLRFAWRGAKWFLFLFLVLAPGCDRPRITTEFGTREMTLPHGQVIKAETMITTADLRRGLMFRTSLAPDHGMLFVHPGPGNYPYWMYQILIPLDIIWMDSDHRIIQIVQNAQPCKTDPNQCTQYYCTKPTNFVLELGGGMAKTYGLALGQTIDW
ncbi:MAG: DUF192 domain-containing protein [Acidobacteriia bacterium]|nr:DUF192 domain-containing protein [Terriglobia bacterium]